MEDKELEGLVYDKLILDHNVHKIIGTVTKLQDSKVGEVKVDDGAVWLVTGLGYLNKESPDSLIQTSLDDIIILSKSQLIEFINKKK